MRTVTIKIRSITAASDGDLSLWLVSAEVLHVHAGRLSEPRVEFLVHSPSRTFRTAEPLGKVVTVTWPDDASSPYAGPISLTR